MTEQRQMLADSVTRLFRDAAAALVPNESAPSTGLDLSLWSEVADLGLPLLLVPEEQGGVGGTWEDVFVVLHAAGYFNIPLPVGEAMLAQSLAAGAGLEPPAGPASLAADVEGRLYQADGEWRFSGTLRSVPWGRNVESVVTSLAVNGQPHIVLLPRSSATLRTAVNLAGEPRDDLSYDNIPVRAAPAAAREAQHLFDYCALLRVAQILGALEAALHRSVDYAKQRKQFGKPIGQFQAVQQQLALFGVEAAAVACAGRAAYRAAAVGNAAFQIAAAKLRANLAVGLGTATAHQVHAAIGFTWEYALRHSTQRLWSWRSEYGTDRYWAERLGAAVTVRGADHFWSDLTDRDDLAGVEL